MASTYRTPGVYIEEISKFPPSIAAVETAIPAFIGYTVKAEKDGEDLNLKPTKIYSMLEYERYFDYTEAQREDMGLGRETSIQVTLSGDDTTNITAEYAPGSGEARYIMYYAMQMFFANGGGPCYVVSIGRADSASGDSPAGSDFSDGLDALMLEDEPTIICMPEAVYLQGSQYRTVIQQALSQCRDLQDRVAIFDVATNTTATSNPTNTDAAAFRAHVPNDIERKKYGAAYYPYLKTSLNYGFLEADVTIDDTRTFSSGSSGTNLGSSATLEDLVNTDNALYNQIKTKLNDLYVVLPPTSAIAGVYARVDNNRGVWKAPANESVDLVVGPCIKINNQLQDGLNIDTEDGRSINAIRSFTGKGTLIWGARTLAGNDNEWRYIPVRRFFNFVEESVKKATARFVFEPNDANTWIKVRTMIENFLTNQWRAGALTGATTDQAYYVRVGLNETMSAEEILEGYMIVEIGMAVVRPAEFIILRFSHKMQEA